MFIRIKMYSLFNSKSLAKTGKTNILLEKLFPLLEPVTSSSPVSVA